MTANNASQGWERLPGETAKAFDAFATYRDMGRNRSAREVWELQGKSRGTVEKWSAQHDWVERAAAFDDHEKRHLAAKRMEDLEQAQSEMITRHAQLAHAIIVLCAQALAQFKATDMKLADIARLVKVATDLERLSRDLPTERLQADVNHAISPLMQLARDITDRKNQLSDAGD